MASLIAAGICLLVSTVVAKAQHRAQAQPPPPSQLDSEPRPGDGNEQEPVKGKPNAGDAAGHSPDFGPETARMIFDSVQHFAEIAAADGWPHIKTPLSPGTRTAPVSTLRKRLVAEDYPPAHDVIGPTSDDELTKSVRRLQSSTGLNETGVVSRETHRELNVPAAARARMGGSNDEALFGPEFPIHRAMCQRQYSSGRRGGGGKRRSTKNLARHRRRAARSFASNHGKDCLGRY